MRHPGRWAIFVLACLALGACLHTSPNADLALLIRDQTAEERYATVMSSDSSGVHSTFASSPLIGKTLTDIGIVKEIVISRDFPGQTERHKRVWPANSLIVHAIRGMRLSRASDDRLGSLRAGECYIRVAYSNRLDVYLLFRKGRPTLASVKTAPHEISEYSLASDPKI